MLVNSVAVIYVKFRREKSVATTDLRALRTLLCMFLKSFIVFVDFFPTCFQNI